jgi:hypothetical protein
MHNPVDQKLDPPLLQDWILVRVVVARRSLIMSSKVRDFCISEWGAAKQLWIVLSMLDGVNLLGIKDEPSTEYYGDSDGVNPRLKAPPNQISEQPTLNTVNKLACSTWALSSIYAIFAYLISSSSLFSWEDWANRLLNKGKQKDWVLCYSVCPKSAYMAIITRKWNSQLLLVI